MTETTNRPALAPASEEAAQSRLPQVFSTSGLLLFYLVLFGAWEVIVPALGVKAYVLPVPTAIVKSLYAGLTTGTFVVDLGITFFELIVGYIIAVVTGLVIGGLIAEFRFFERAVYPLVVALQSVPKIALAPLLLIWFGFGLQSKIIMAALVAFFPMLVNTVNGLRAYDADMYELFLSLKASRWQQLRYLKLPAAVPFLIAGLDVSFVLALLGAIVGEFVGASKGLGYTVLQLQFTLDTAGVFAILVILGLVGVAGHTIISALGKRVAFWQAANIGRR